MCDWRVEGFRGVQGGDWIFATLDEDWRGLDIYSILYYCGAYYRTGVYKWFRVYYYKTTGEKEYNNPHTKFLIYLERGTKLIVRTKTGKVFIVELDNTKHKIINCNKKEGDGFAW